MTSELDLFTAPAQRHSATSIAAAQAIEPVAQTLKRQVFEYLKRCGEDGATDSEIQSGLNMDGDTQRPRRVKLVEEGLVVDSGQKRPTRSGHPAVVWTVAPLTHQQAA